MHKNLVFKSRKLIANFIDAIQVSMNLPIKTAHESCADMPANTLCSHYFERIFLKVDHRTTRWLGLKGP